MSDNAEKALTASAGRTANTLYAHMLMNIVGICVVLQGRPALVLANSAGNTAAMAQSLANMSAGVGILEFLLNATAGKLSDTYGRRMFLMASPIVNFIMKAGVFATQVRSLTAIVDNRFLLTVLLTFSMLT